MLKESVMSSSSASLVIMTSKRLIRTIVARMVNPASTTVFCSMSILQLSSRLCWRCRLGTAILSHQTTWFVSGAWISLKWSEMLRLQRDLSTCRRTTTMTLWNLASARLVNLSLSLSSRRKRMVTWTIPSTWLRSILRTLKRRSPFSSTVIWESFQERSLKWTRWARPVAIPMSSLLCQIPSVASNFHSIRSRCLTSFVAHHCEGRSGAASAVSSAASSYTTYSRSWPHSRLCSIDQKLLT